MNEVNSKLKVIAEKYRDLYRLNQCSRDEAKKNIMPYLDAINEKSKEIAKKYNQKPRLASFISYVR